MTAELNDEVVAPRFEDKLWTELARIHAEEDLAPGPQRPGRRLVLAGAVAVAAAVALVAGMIVTGVGPGGNAKPALAATIAEATRAALADSIVHETMDWSPTQSGPLDDLWYDETSSAIRIVSYSDNGDLLLESGTPAGVDPASATSVVTVNYCLREYTEKARPTGSGTNRAELVVELLDDGSMTVDGTEVIDGQELIRMHERSAPEFSWYVDPDTYRPVLIVSEVGEGNDRPSTTTIDYIPRTPENLALLTTAIPPDFIQVDDLDSQPGCI
jgi:hypothetical protein